MISQPVKGPLFCGSGQQSKAYCPVNSSREKLVKSVKAAQSEKPVELV